MTWDLPEVAREAYRATLDIDDLTGHTRAPGALAIGVNGVAQYWTTYHTFAVECLQRLHAITADAQLTPLPQRSAI